MGSTIISDFTKNPKFTAASTAIYSHILPKLDTIEKFGFVAVPDTVPSMLRLYMAKAQELQQSFSNDKYDSLWLPLFINKGFTQKVTRLFFDKLDSLNKSGLLPREIWLPNPANSLNADGSTQGKIDSAGMSPYLKYGLIAGGVVISGVLLTLVLKRN
jgi:hypothetical protein